MTAIAGAALRLASVPAFAAPPPLDDPQARAALPEFKTIPAARPEELTPAAPLRLEGFARWTRSQGDNGARRYSTLKQITKENVRDLAMAWTFRSGDGAANVQCTPIIVDGLLFAPTPGRAIVALDAATGAEVWRKKLEAPRQVRAQDAPARRGLVYWPGDRENAPRILFGCGDWIYAVEPKTGNAIVGFGENGRTPIETGATASGAVFQHVYITTGINGDVFAFDVRVPHCLSVSG